MSIVPYGRIVAVSAVVGGLLLIAPWVPPQLAFGAFIALTAVGVLVYSTLHIAGSEIVEGWREAGRDLEPEPDEVEQVQQRYIDGELTDEEFEEELERLEDEIQ